MNKVAAALHERLHHGLRCPEWGLPADKVVVWCSLAERAVELEQVARRALAADVAELVTNIDWGHDGFTEGVREAVGVLLPDRDSYSDCPGLDDDDLPVGVCRLPAGHDGAHALWSTILDE